MSVDNEILNIARRLEARVGRVETKIVRGFEELGVDIGITDWLAVDDVNRTVTLTTLGRSLMVILAEMPRAGATQLGKSYDLLYKGRVVGTVVLQGVLV